MCSRFDSVLWSEPDERMSAEEEWDLYCDAEDRKDHERRER